MKSRLAPSFKWNADFPAVQHILDVAIFGRLLDGSLNQRLGAAQKPLTVLQALVVRIAPPINDMHGHSPVYLSRLASRACTIRQVGGPDARYNRVRPCARRIHRVSFRCRRLSWIRTKSREADPRLARRSVSR